MRLIVNADDLGLCRGVNHGVADAFATGIVRSTTIMPTGDAFRHGVELASRLPGLGVGVHLTLTWGRPVGRGYGTLLGRDGAFPGRDAFLLRADALDQEEVEAEWTAQVERVMAAGIRPTHLDSHHHVHLHTPQLLRTGVRVAARFGLPLRLADRSRLPEDLAGVPGPDLLITRFHRNQTAPGDLFSILDEIPDGRETVELMCHPAYLDSYLMEHSSYNQPRMEELATLTHPDVARYVEERGILLIHYGQLKG